MRQKFLHLALFCVFCFGALSFTGCKLIFEPETDCIVRVLGSMPSANFRHYRETCDGEKVCKQLGELGSIVSSNWYNAKNDIKGFYEITKIERAEDTGRSYVYVTIKYPASGPKVKTLPLVFEMQRIKLRWHIYAVQGIDEFNRRATRERGIL